MFFFSVFVVVVVDLPPAMEVSIVPSGLVNTVSVKSAGIRIALAFISRNNSPIIGARIKVVAHE